MNADLLLTHFDRISDAPDAIPRFRRFILDLAVRGKIAPQNPDDEPAFKLLKCIKAEKARLTAAGVLRREKPLPPVADDKAPFAVPPSWSWARIGTVSLLTEYGTSVKSDQVEGGVPVLKMGDIQAGQVILGGQKKVPRQIEDLPQLFLKRFDLLYNRTNSAELVGKTGIYMGEDDAYTFASYLIRIRFLNSLTSAAYANLAMNAAYFRATQILPELQQQCGQANVNGSKLRNMLIPLPPLAEQHRIVARGNELMGLCDRLAEGLSERENRRDRLTATSHHHLNNGADVESLRKHGHFFIGHIPRLSARPDQIKQLRQTILNLAVRGQVVSQHANDQSPHEMLRSVTNRRKGLIAEGKLRRIESVPTVSDAPPFTLPNNWEWTFPDQLSKLTSNALTIGPFGSNLVTSDYAVSGTPLVFVSDIRSEFAEPPKHYISSIKANELRGHSTGPEDLLVTKMGDPPGDTAIYPANRPRAVITADCIKWSLDETLVLVRYLYFAIRAPLIAGQITEITKGAAHQKVSLKRFRGIYLPLPPLSEQHRIVAKVDELMTLCDKLEEQLTTAQTVSSHLLDAVLHHALSDLPVSDELLQHIS